MHSLKMTIEEALEFADEWSRGLTLHEESQGWRVVCMILAEEVRRLRNAVDDAADCVTQNASAVGREPAGEASHTSRLLED